MTDITGALRDAIAWVRGEPTPPTKPEAAKPADEDEDKSSSNPLVWFWEAIEGDFNDDRNTKQILVDAAISMIPLVDQVCDIRDLIANCRKIIRNPADGWAWVSFALTLIGLFPTLGSLVKGVLKIFFAFVRRAGGHAIAEAVEAAMTWVITYLRRHEVQKYVAKFVEGNLFNWLATRVKRVRGVVNVPNLLSWFDNGIKTLEGLVPKFVHVPKIGVQAKEALEVVKRVRLMADKYLAEALKPIDDILNKVIARLECEALIKRAGIVDASNIHYLGVIPEAAAVALMRKQKPAWLTHVADPIYPGLDPALEKHFVASMAQTHTVARPGFPSVPRKPSEIFPHLTDGNIASFHKMTAATIKGPAKMYRILAPNSKGMSDCWVTEKVFHELQNAPDPKAAWRKFLAVWPDWNVNGQFVVYDLKKGESLNVYRGPASSQTKKALPGYQLEGGAEQIIFKLAPGDLRADEVLYHKIKNGKTVTLGKPMTQAEVDKATAGMNGMQKQIFYNEHLMLRVEIKHPSISGPFDTGWGYTEFDGAGMTGKIGLPALPGQVTKK